MMEFKEFNLSGWIQHFYFCPWEFVRIPWQNPNKMWRRGQHPLNKTHSAPQRRIRAWICSTAISFVRAVTFTSEGEACSNNSHPLTTRLDKGRSQAALDFARTPKGDRWCAISEAPSHARAFGAGPSMRGALWEGQRAPRDLRSGTAEASPQSLVDSILKC